MALEFKGLKGKALTARANIDRLNKAYDKFNEMAPTHAADVEALAGQVENMNDDLAFAVTALGNGGGHDEEKRAPEKEKVVVQADEVGKLDAGIIAEAPPAVGVQNPVSPPAVGLPQTSFQPANN
jgi:branched-subunit amino acid aminotransferase/4-amino-4-deoxychorismate lyase